MKFPTIDHFWTSWLSYLKGSVTITDDREEDGKRIITIEVKKTPGGK